MGCAANRGCLMRPSKDPQTALGAAVHELREERSLSKNAVAEKSELSSDYYSAIEDGQTNPSWGTMRRVAKALDLDVTELAKREEAQPANPARVSLDPRPPR